MAGKRLFFAGAAAVAAAVTTTFPAVGIPTPITTAVKSQQYYVLAGHPDDPVPHWAWLEQRPLTDYLVFITTTRSEGTLACVSVEDAQPEAPSDVSFAGAAEPLQDVDVPDEIAESEPNQFASLLVPATGQPWVLPFGEASTGPYRYEGPDSPVGQPDHGERHPYGFPWTGQGSEACAKAQVASWHWFLDEAHLIDGIGTTMQVADPWRDDDFQGRHCFKPTAKIQARTAPRRQQHEICAEVWANAESARVALDLPDVYSIIDADGEQQYSDLAYDEHVVAEALAFIRQNRGVWDMPVLPEAGILAVGSYANNDPCDAGASKAHKPLLDLVRWTDLDIGEQAGPLACEDDPYGQGSDVEHVSFTSMNPATLVAWNVVDPPTGTRIGPVVKNFGWLLPSYAFDGCVGCAFWRRTS